MKYKKKNNIIISRTKGSSTICQQFIPSSSSLVSRFQLERFSRNSFKRSKLYNSQKRFTRVLFFLEKIGRFRIINYFFILFFIFFSSSFFIGDELKKEFQKEKSGWNRYELGTTRSTTQWSVFCFFYSYFVYFW